METPQDRSAAEDLALIRRMMDAGRQKAAFDGVHLVIWGSILMLAYFIQYLQMYDYLPRGSLWVWLPAFIMGWSLSFLAGRRSSCIPDESANLAVKAYNSAWFAVGITMVLHFLTAVAAQAFDPKAITVLACGVIACAFYVISVVTEIKALKLVSGGWWLVLIYATALSEYDPEILLVLSAASALLILLPGQLMRRLANNTTADNRV